MTTRSYSLFATLLALVVAIAAYRIHIENQPFPPDDADGTGYATFSLIEDNLYVGGRTHNPPPGTDAVLSLSFNEDIYKTKFHRYSPIPDHAPAPSLDWLKKQVDFVDQQTSAGRQVYIHCDAGCSRSVMVAAAYLMQKHRWDRDTAITLLRDKRPGARPHPAFLVLLDDWEKQLGLQPEPAVAPTGYVNHATYSQVDDHLYLGGRTDAPPPGTLAVLSLSYNPDLYKAKFHQYSSIPDGGRAPTLDWLKQQVAFVDEHQKANQVTFIHCDAGISRAALVTTAYLMYKNHWPRDHALEVLKEKRPIISPNIYFMDLLLDWEDALNGVVAKPQRQE